ncbi:DUF481 domain-containing protein [Robertkochia flava]|uniref:DUF481 domain-containing protein n=1 Tax=Robertkochia flava TaxID=3447986 RepID=UPI001CCD5C0E|nr:DUF481 domain-containing protein [Robertkochia marina]
MFAKAISTVMGVIAFSFFVVSGPISAQQDTLLLNNSDRIIGEIKGMNNGVLTIEPEYSDKDFKITWIDVQSIRSSQYYMLTVENGDRFSGSISTREKDSAQVTIYHFAGNKTVPVGAIVSLRPIKENFLSRLDISISLGFNFTKSNSLRQFSVRSLVKYSGKEWTLNSSFNAIRSSQDEASKTTRTDANIGGVYLLKNDWFTAVNADFLSNDEQQLNLRVTSRAIAGSFLIHSNKLYLAWGAGVAWNNEKFNDELNTNRNSLEGVGGLQLDIFDIGDLDLFSSLFAYPSLTQGDRVRVDFKTDLKYDLPMDFFIKLGYTLNFDSSPVTGAAKEDYILQTTFGWELD